MGFSERVLEVRGVRFLRSSISLSLLVHVLFALACMFLLTQRTATLPSRPLTWIEVEPFDPAKLKKKLSEDQQKQIAQTEKGQKTDTAAPDAFLGETTQTVDRQSVSEKKQVAMGSSKPKAVPNQQEKSSAQSKVKDVAIAPALSKLGVSVLPSAKDLAKTDIQNEVHDNWADQSATGPQDYVKGIRESDRTLLNTKEYIFYGYFQRIRQRLELAWVPLLREKIVKIYRSGRKIATNMDHQTKLLVILNQGGEIVRVQILSESGSQDLDDAAVRAFNQAGPFPNPPKGIVDANREIQIPWEFVLKT
jgi:protein TonB